MNRPPIDDASEAITGQTSFSRSDQVTSARARHVTQKAVLDIQAMIRSGQLKPGEAIPSQRALAQQLGVSRAALREALSILDTLGMVRIEAARGMFVTDSGETAGGDDAPIHSWRFAARYSPQEVYQFRQIAEPQAASLAAMHRTDDELHELQANLEAFREAARTMDLVQSSQLDFEFHRQIMQMSRNRMLVDLHRTYHQVLEESQRLPFSRHDRVWEPVLEHDRVLLAIGRGDPEGSSYYMRSHIHRAAERVGVTIVGIP